MKGNNQSLLQRAIKLKLYGLIVHWQEVENADWVEPLIAWEETERTQRSLERRLNQAKLGRFKPLSEFDWHWPEESHQAVVEEWMKLQFIHGNTNLILCGPNGVGKSTIARNIAYQSVLKGHTALFTTASKMLNELAVVDSDTTLRRRIQHYVKPLVLIIDEVGYLSYANRHADLLFEVITRRYEEKPTIITTNKPFAQWKDIFPNASCVVSIIDRLVHYSDIINIKAQSFRLKEAKEKNKNREAKRNPSKPKKNTKDSEVNNEHQS